jgi:photosystem II stability/assembly factor-like uncharacterized protein
MVRERTAVLIGAALALLLSCQTDATDPNGTDVPVWTSLGPDASSCIRWLVVDPSDSDTLYLGAETLNQDFHTVDAEVLKSTDCGANWTTIGAGLPASPTRSLLIDPSDTSTLYAGTGDGIYKSSDAGVNWNSCSAGLPGDTWCNLAIDPSNTETVYAGGAFGGMYKSTNGGASWNAISITPPCAWIGAVVVDPASPTTLYAGTGNGVYKSTNGGAGWTAMNNGLHAPGTLYVVAIHAVAIDLLNPDSLYASATYAGRQALFKSNDAAGSWVCMRTEAGGIVGVAIDSDTPTTLYAQQDNAVFRSTNGGGSWTRVSQSFPSYVTTLVVDPLVPTRVYVGTYLAGVYTHEF